VRFAKYDLLSRNFACDQGHNIENDARAFLRAGAMDNIDTEYVDGGGAPLTDMPAGNPRIDVNADLAATFTFASHQNSIPVIRSIRIENQNADSIENVRLELTASPAFLRAKNWIIDRIAAGDGVTLSDRRVDLDANYLAGLDEAERGDITLRLMQAECTLAETVVPVRLLARDEWGGVVDMGQLLPAFVMPNDPAIFPLLRSAVERLAAHGHSSALDGYQSGDPKRAYMLIAAVYSAIAALGLHYAQPPASFERRGQKVRGPSKVVREGLATCLDTTLLFAAALEAAGLNAVVLLLDGHAFVGAWLVKRTLPRTVEDDVAEVRKAIAAHELVVLETTSVTHRPAMTFEQAKKLGEAKLDENAAQCFVSAVDIARSRSGGIMPLASHEIGEPNAAEEDDGQLDIALPAEPDFLMPADVVDQKPNTPAGRIDRWQNRLLDLSLRNRLLNFSDSKRTVSFLCPDVAYLEDRLAGGAAIKLISLPEQNPLGQRDAELHREKRGRDLHRSFASEALQRDELASMLEPKELFARLTALYRQAKSDLTEGGTNTLYLAIGLLKWKKKPTDERIYRAPLLLLPVKLERTGASDRFRLRFHEDEPRLNATLMQFLKIEFDLVLPDFREGLPRDGNGIDVLQLLDQIRRAVRDAPGLEVADDIALSTFSFAKYLMWKDLTERTDALRQNRVVRHLIDNPERAFAGAEQPFPGESDVDRVYAPADIVMPLPADSSQVAASLAATQGRDFVIVGPPGTGKSQTIANMIASCLAARKTVLFVAEKTAALDVVYRRLREHGLGDHCLELHSNKTDRKHFFSQLKRSWEKRGGSGESQWVTLNERLRVRRDELNSYVTALHRRSPNGLTPYIAMGVATAGHDAHAPALRWSSMDAHDAQAYTALDDLAAQLGQTFAAVTMRPVLRLIQVEEWTGAWQEQLLSAARTLGRAALETKAALERLSKRFGLAGVEDCRADGIGYFADLARDVIATSGTDQTIILHKDFAALTGAIGDLERAIASYRNDEARLSQTYAPDVVPRIPVNELDREWHQANAAMWPKSWFAVRRIRRLLGSYAGSKTVDPAIDLPVIRKLQSASQAIAANALARVPLAFAGLDTDCSQLRQHLERAGRLRTSLVQLGEFAGDVQSVATSIAAGLKGQVNQPQLTAGKEFIARHQELNDAVAAFESLSGHPASDYHADDFLGRLSGQMDELEQSRNLFRDWSSWCAVRARAIAQGLEPLVSDLESGAVLPSDARAAFRLAYARWWLPLAIDDSRELRRFRRFQHENAIADFRDVDDLVRAHASQKVVSSLIHGLPAADAVPRKSELGLLRHQMALQRPSASIREMIGAMPESFSQLAPCLLMSPLSIAQYLPTHQALFDVVIFDEASQIATWDAVGAIARGRQTIIVGDPKQLPPTNFFERNDADGDDIPQHEQDLESILDEAQASGLPTRQLRWHYRSRHESLIAFSNWHYYSNNLITFPSPVTEDQAVSLAFVPAGVYDRGKSRTNREEARAIVADVRARLEAWLVLPELQRPTLGVITFNMPQQALILDLLDDARRDNPELEWFFSEDRIEPVIVKNLENIQGDERDVILFSITYCRDAANKLPMSFGAINNNGGERRLNVAVTRARRELKVFSGIRADDIDLGRSRATGVQHLKAFLDYAVRGAIALPAQDAGSQGPMESPFEEAVAAKLERRGWRIVPQVGVSGFRIDLAVRHPDHAGIYLAGIECDGATYHSSATARDRDKVREQVLRGLGWTILRVWSTDWWFNAEEAIERLHQGLEVALAESRATHATEAKPQTVPAPAGRPGKDVDDIAVGADAAKPAAPGESDDQLVNFDAPASVGGRIASPYQAADERAGGSAQPTFAIADLSAFNPDPDRFFEHSYRSILQAMVDAIMEQEAPLREDVLAQRVARAHGWLRTGARIRERIALHLRSLDRTEESSGTFLWKPGAIAPRVPFREPLHPRHHRAVPDICLAEIVDFVLMHPIALDEDDPPLVYARLLRVDRLAASSRERLKEAIVQAQALI
jgi:very-short-patch-repair endonuclease